MNHEVHYAAYRRFLKAYGESGEGARKLAIARDEGLDALNVVVERDLLRLMAEMRQDPGGLDAAIRRATVKSEEEMESE